MKSEAWIQRAALEYIRTVQPLKPNKGCQQEEDVQLAFMAGAEAAPVTRLISLKEVAETVERKKSLPRSGGRSVAEDKLLG